MIVKLRSPTSSVNDMERGSHIGTRLNRLRTRCDNWNITKLELCTTHILFMGTANLCNSVEGYETNTWNALRLEEGCRRSSMERSSQVFA